MVKPKVAPTLDGGPWFDERVGFDPRSSHPEERTGAVLHRLKAERADLAILFPNSFRSALMAWRSGARRRVGYARGGRGFLLTDRLAVPLAMIGDRFAPRRSSTIIERSPERSVARTTARRSSFSRPPRTRPRPTGRGIGSDLSIAGQVVCLNTGGAFGPAKSWPEEHFATLAQSARRRVGRLGPGRLRTRRARGRAVDRRASRSSKRRQPGRRTARDRSDQGVHPSLGAPGDDRLRPSSLRDGLRRPRLDALRPDAHRLDLDLSPQGPPPPSSRPLRPLPAADLSRAPPPLPPRDEPRCHLLGGGRDAPRARSGAERVQSV